LDADLKVHSVIGSGSIFTLTFKSKFNDKMNTLNCPLISEIPSKLQSHIHAYEIPTLSVNDIEVHHRNDVPISDKHFLSDMDKKPTLS
jgi:hypothetical protein